MTSKLMFVPDTHVVVPKAPSIEMIDSGYIVASEHLPRRAHPISKIYGAMICASPQLTTPPVLRWESDRLFCGNSCMCRVSTSISGELFMLSSPFLSSGEVYRSKDKARRAAEKALGIPFEVEEV